MSSRSSSRPGRPDRPVSYRKTGQVGRSKPGHNPVTTRSNPVGQNELFDAHELAGCGDFQADERFILEAAQALEARRQARARPGAFMPVAVRPSSGAEVERDYSGQISDILDGLADALAWPRGSRDGQP